MWRGVDGNFNIIATNYILFYWLYTGIYFYQFVSFNYYCSLSSVHCCAEVGEVCWPAHKLVRANEQEETEGKLRLVSNKQHRLISQHVSSTCLSTPASTSRESETRLYQLRLSASAVHTFFISTSRPCLFNCNWFWSPVAINSVKTTAWSKSLDLYLSYSF